MPHQSSMTKPSHSIAEIERLLGISHSAVYGLIKTGELVTFTIGRRRFVSREALDRFIRAREAESLPPPPKSSRAA